MDNIFAGFGVFFAPIPLFFNNQIGLYLDSCIYIPHWQESEKSVELKIKENDIGLRKQEKNNIKFC